MHLRPLIHLVLLGLAAQGVQAERRDYNTTVTTVFTETKDIDKELAAFKAELRRGGITEEQIRINSDSFRDQIVRRMDGLAATGTGRFAWTETGSYTEVPMAASSPLDPGPFSWREWFDGEVTVSLRSDGRLASVEPGDKRNAGAMPGLALFHTGLVIPGVKEIGSEVRDGLTWVTYEGIVQGQFGARVLAAYRDPGRTDLAQVEQRWFSRRRTSDVIFRATRSADGKTLEVVHYGPATLKTETHSLAQSNSDGLPPLSEIVPLGTPMTDYRLGEDERVTYAFSGTLPTIDELRAMRGLGPLASLGLPGWIAIPTGLVLLSAATVIGLRKRH
ncbi:MAG: hypothetical protein KF884_00180 [Fimbriimonadaceae bacterium]|nr:hypothetical protein [Fimbriimonadaceae bacterium]QYK58512.1 MAG: hypothetical protein KF884_00180 [Fimbriimonadaceae bacterium]